jgi:photosystem II stability/assembly factor-like uncharacterized protein
MKKNIGEAASIVLFLLICGACNLKTPDPARMLGWTVGGSDGYGLILHTEDGGQTWVRQGNASQLPDAGFQDICILDANTLLVTGDVLPDGTYNLFKSLDSGKNWARVNSESLMNLTYSGIFALGREHVWIVGESGTIYRSDDQGGSWTRIGVPLEYQFDTFLRIAARDANDLWVVGDTHAADAYPIMLHTTDGGKKWDRLNPVGDLQIQGGKDGHFLAIKLFGNSVWAVGGFGKFVIRSGDNGRQWSHLRSSGAADANDIFVLSESEAYVAEDYSGFFYTADAGASWDDYSFFTGNWYLGVAVLQGKHIWVVGSPGAGNTHSAIIYSADGGLSWTQQTAQVLEDTYIGLYKVRFILEE